MLTCVHAAVDVRIFHKEAKALAQAGHEVMVVGPHPADELRDLVRIIALPKRTNRIARLLLSPVEVLIRALGVRAQVYHFHDPELIPVGLLLLKMGKRVIYDIHEYTEEDIATKSWLPSYARRPVSRFVGWLERRAVQKMDGVIVVNDHMAERIRPLAKRPDRVVSVYNYPDHAGSDAPPAIAEREPLASYVGVLSRERGWETLLEAGKQLDRSFPEGRVNVIGPLWPIGIADAYWPVERWAHYNVEYEGVIAHTEVFARLQRARIGLIPWLPTMNHEHGTPVKLFEYMMAGLAVVVPDLAVMGELVDREQIGLTYPPGDAAAMGRAIGRLAEDPELLRRCREQGRKLAIEVYNAESQVEALAGAWGLAASKVAS